MRSSTAEVISPQPKIARVLDGQLRGADESGQRPLIDDEEAVDDLWSHGVTSLCHTRQVTMSHLPSARLVPRAQGTGSR